MRLAVPRHLFCQRVRPIYPFNKQYLVTHSSQVSILILLRSTNFLASPILGLLCPLSLGS